MIWILLLLTVLFLALIPVTVTLELHHNEGTRLRLTLRLLCFHYTAAYRLQNTGRGHRFIREKEPSPVPSDASGRLRPIRQALRSSPGTRRFLLAHMHLLCLDGWIALHTGDAARSALLSGAVQGVLACMRPRAPIRLQVWPAFYRPRSSAYVRCIFRFRPGTLFLTAGMLLPGIFRALHPTESEVSAYGTSHR